jgi:toxin FitB
LSIFPGRNLAQMILDTNIISEPAKPHPNTKVMQWLDQLDLASCYITAITVAELLAGVERLPPGKKREKLKAIIDYIVNDSFAGRVLSFDLVSAHHYAFAIEKLRRVGLNGMNIDVMIAAVALAHDMDVATRDSRPFDAVGVQTINPWTDE